MKISQVKKVMMKYKKAWEEQDSNLILECFIKNGVYQESPLSKPYKGHEEIKKFWDREVVKKQKKIKFTLGKCYVSVDGKTGFAEWRASMERLGKTDYMVGIMLLRIKENKISYLNEYWNTKTRKK